LNASSIRDALRTFGPAWLVMIADVDVASIVTGFQVGATWGYLMVGVMLALTVPLFVIQDVAGVLGTVSGMGLGTAIRQLYGRRAAQLASIPMATADVMEYVAEYAGIAVGLRLLGLPVIPGLLTVFLIHIAVAWSGRYRYTEAALLPISFVLVAALLLTVFMVKLDPTRLGTSLLSPWPIWRPDFDYMLAASVGSVIMPWMLFFHSGADARKGLRPKDLRPERAETLLGAIVSELLMAATVIVGIFLGQRVGDALNAEALAEALQPLGSLSRYVMGVGFIASGFLALVVISMASAWGFLEAVNFRRGTLAYRLAYVVESVPAVVIVALSLSGLISLILDLMAAFTIILAPLLYMLGKIASREDVAGEARLRGARAAAYWVMSALVVASGLVALAALL